MDSTLSLAGAGALLGCGAWIVCALAALLGSRGVLACAGVLGGTLGLASEIAALTDAEALARVLQSGGGLLLLACAAGGLGGAGVRERLARATAAVLVLVLALTDAGLPAGAGTTPSAGAHALAALVLCLLGARVARASVLSRLVAAVLASVLVATIGASAAAGERAASTVAQERRSGAEAALAAQTRLLEAAQRSATQAATVIAGCERRCTTLVSELEIAPGSAAVLVGSQQAEVLPGSTLLDERALALLPGQSEVRAVAGARAGEPTAAAALTVLPGARGLQLVALGVRQRSPGTAVVYLVPVTVAALDESVEGSPRTLRVRGAGAEVASSSFSAAEVLASATITSSETQFLVEVGAVPLASSPSRDVVRDVVLAGACVLVLAVLLALVLGGQITRRVRLLTADVLRAPERVREREDDEAAPTPVQGGDEVATLGQAFSEMVRALRTQQGALEERVASETVLRARLAATLESLSDAVLTLSATGEVVQSNPAAQTLWAAAGAAEALAGPGATALLRVTPVSAGAEAQPLTPVLEGVLAGVSASWAGRCVLGEEVPVDVRVSRLSGDGSGAVVVVRDLRGAEEVERMKTEFLSNISHELRTPLTPITGYVSILRRRPDLSPERRESFLEIVSDSSSRLTRVVDLLVDVASLEAGRVRLRHATVDLRDLSTTLVEKWRSAPSARGRTIEIRVPRRAVRVSTDAEWLTKALDELVDNALKYSPPDAPVQVEVRQQRGGASVHVVDAGAGMDEQQREALFGQFTQADGSATRRVGGLGLGLSFVRRVAEELGCGLVVESQPGAGTRVVVELRR